MATVEHCLYCFEALASHLEKRRGLSLADIEQSWAEYAKSLAADGTTDTEVDPDKSAKASKQIPALRRLAAAAAAASSSSHDAGSGSGSSSPNSSSTMSLAASTPGTSTTSLPTAAAAPRIEESPLFVTWNTVSKSGYRSLRGCIGTFEAQDLADGLSSYSLTSALHDIRFHPVEASELPTLEVAVTLLTDFEDCDDAMDWELGTHGLRISFTYHGKRYGATYLPDVAVEQEWTKEETLVSLMRKAGWMGRKDKWRDVELTVVRYQGKKLSLEYKEYKAWRDWANEHKATGQKK